MRRIGRRLGAATVVATVLGLVVSTTGASAVTARNPFADPIALAPAGAVDPAGAGAPSLPLTLITGDTVHVGLDADGKPAVRDIDQAPRADGAAVAFHTITKGERVYLVPGDAMPLIGAGVLDWELFNLVELGKHVAASGTTGEVPVIVERTQAAAARAATAQVAGVTVGRELPSIDSVAMTVDGDGSWWQAVQAAVDDAPAARATTASGPLAGVEKVWLNGLVQVSLADSVPQVGAPTAWGGGFDGTGVTVAVLDTGIDANHPDVAGKIVGQKDFIDNDDDAADGHGHGTHVAATVAGTGDASAGLRPGVAPGADLLVGKVLSDGGSGSFEQIIAGMEWAAQSGAPIVSMSIGGGSSNGRDPLSQAVNQLSAEYGTLFVIAAGNSGPAPGTLTTPGTADAALTVAAVDKSDEMAEFSGRGPRIGDNALKPDIAAPGVAITAARAAGTSMGTPADDLHTTASGTSMATPHVAGAAALLAQQDPELTGPQLKALLMNTALDLGHDVYAQGSGRLDAARAIDPVVYADGNISFGRFEYPHQPVTDTVTYTNVTDAPVTLDLVASMAAGDGTPAPAGLLSLSADQVTVPAGGTASVEVTLDGSVLGAGDVFGSYHGRIAATGPAGEMLASSRVGAFLEPQRFDVTVEIVPPAGATEVSYRRGMYVLPVDDQVGLHDGAALLKGDRTFTARLFDGTYAFAADVEWKDADGKPQRALPTAPEVTVAGAAVSVVLDLNQARRVYTDVGEDTEAYAARLNQMRLSEARNWGLQSTLLGGVAYEDVDWWALPTEPVTLGWYSFTSEEVLVPPMVTMEAIGGGAPIPLHPRYVTPDSSVPGGLQQWQEGDKLHTRTVRLPVPRLTGLDRSRLVYAGTGTPAELDAAGVDGALVLITPTVEVCQATCVDDLLMPIVADAADRGAAGVLVAGDPAAGSHQVRLTYDEFLLPGYDCPDGPDSCPPIEPYAPVPVVSLPTAEGVALVDRLAGQDSLRAFIRGYDQAPRAYALVHVTNGQVPDSMPWQADRSGLERVVHRFHADQPGEVLGLSMTILGTSVSMAEGFDLPLTATQTELPVYSGHVNGEPLRFAYAVSTAGYAAPMVLDGATYAAERMDVVPDAQDAVSWNTRPSTPAAMLPQPWENPNALNLSQPTCAGCREGDVFYPTLYLATGGGAVTHVAGLLNNQLYANSRLSAHSCEPPRCELHFYDEAGNEFEQRLIPIGFRIGADGQLTGTGFGATVGPMDEETNR